MNNKTKIIVPLRVKSFEELKSKVEQVGDRADVVEVWLDKVYEEDGFFDKLHNLVETCHWRVSTGKKVRFLAVCKSPAEKGTFKGKDKERANILQAFLHAGGDYIDLDVTQNSEDVIDNFPSEKLILSYHDFAGELQDVDKFFEQQRLFNPAIYKFAITTNTQGELGSFLQFVKDFPEDLQGIFTTMGAMGERGRELIAQTGRSWGAFYALDEESRTASGQKTLDQL